MHIAQHNTDEKVFIVAEIGNNHEGRFEVAQELVRQAAAAGVDAVKFQTFQARLFTSNKDEARFKRLSSFQLTYDQFAELETLARSLGVLFMSTPLDLESADFLAPRVDAFKIASGDNNFYPLIEKACRSGKPVIISTGMSDLAQVDATVQFATERMPREKLALLHCVASYPAPEDESLNLAAVRMLAERTGCVTGYSDHTIGSRACLISVALGARIIEKHFTLDHHFSEFRDHLLSADPSEMKQLVQDIRLYEKMIGSPRKELQDCEVAVSQAARRSIVANKELAVGHRITNEDLLWIRPAGGLAPGNEDKLVGHVLKRAVTFGEMIRVEDVD